MSVEMSDKYIFCPYCEKSTWVRVADYAEEEIGGYQINTAISNGKCETCGRQIKFVEIFGIEIEKPMVDMDYFAEAGQDNISNDMKKELFNEKV